MRIKDVCRNYMNLKERRKIFENPEIKWKGYKEPTSDDCLHCEDTPLLMPFKVCFRAKGV